jgi:hypothetical protein
MAKGQASERQLTARELNRATLARQMLLEREAVSLTEAMERVASLPAEAPNSPYIGLWTRLPQFPREDLTRLMEERQVVRATMMRAAPYLVTTNDYALLRPALQPALTRSLTESFRKRAEGLPMEEIIKAARASFEEQPRTFTELRPLLKDRFSDHDPDAMSYAVRTHLPLVQTPEGSAWNAPGNPAHALTEQSLGRALDMDPNPRTLILRYLAAFGPASVLDIQAWSGLFGLKSAVTELREELVTFRDEQGRELFDLPDAPLPPADTPAPIRFLPEYENILLAYANLSRLLPDRWREKVFLSAGRVRATFLIDGFVAGVWWILKDGRQIRFRAEPFEDLSTEMNHALLDEGSRLLRWIEDQPEDRQVRHILPRPK